MFKKCNFVFAASMMVFFSVITSLHAQDTSVSGSVYFNGTTTGTIFIGATTDSSLESPPVVSAPVVSGTKPNYTYTLTLPADITYYLWTMIDNNSPYCISSNINRILNHKKIKTVIENAQKMIKNEFRLEKRVEEFKVIFDDVL